MELFTQNILSTINQVNGSDSHRGGFLRLNTEVVGLNATHFQRFVFFENNWGVGFFRKLKNKTVLLWYR